MDYKEFGEKAEEDDKMKMIVIKDENTGCLGAHAFEQKGATDTWIVDRLCDDIAMFGHTDMILKF